MSLDPDHHLRGAVRWDSVGNEGKADSSLSSTPPALYSSMKRNVMGAKHRCLIPLAGICVVAHSLQMETDGGVPEERSDREKSANWRKRGGKCHTSSSFPFGLHWTFTYYTGSTFSYRFSRCSWLQDTHTHTHRARLNRVGESLPLGIDQMENAGRG